MELNLVQAYKNTTYQVENPPIKIRIGKHHPNLDYLLDKFGKKKWLFITAWNPASKAFTSDENELRNNSLETEFGDKVYFQGSGIPDNDRWTPEKSFLVLGYSKDEAKQLANMDRMQLYLDLYTKKQN